MSFDDYRGHEAPGPFPKKPFTDDDLKDLKDLLGDPQASGFFTEEMANGILARLEAAEKKAAYASHTYHCPMLGLEEPCQCGLQSIDQSWRLKAGK